MEDIVDYQVQPKTGPKAAQPLACETATVIPAGFWGNLDAAQELWADCLATRTPDPDPVAKLVAMGRLFGIHRAPDAPACLANLAWTNGAFLAADGQPLQALQHLTGDQSAHAESLLSVVLQTRGVAGSSTSPIDDQRLFLARALPPDPIAHYGSSSNLARVAAHAGWLAYHHPLLVTARIVGGGPLGYARHFLGIQLLRQLSGWETSRTPRRAMPRRLVAA
ncbi:MAG TPA: hypothetical protein P5205_22105 [Candidatus Paceibacterota bacterium]|nr:hypothetical protein [Verrucomicrobiota bacterium]HSA13054.1 hypothetical protein [Candidatus Paceibacterota bacterium]